MTAGQELAAQLANLARELEAETDPTAILRRVVEAAVREVDGAQFAGVTIVEQGGASTPACTDDLVARVDAIQYEAGEGPCLDAAADEPVVRSNNLGTDQRWPVFAPRAAAHGLHAMLSFQLFTRQSTVGALNLYASAPDVFGADAIGAGVPLAAHAAIALATTRAEANLRLALDSRDVIGQAKGILMERHKITADRAFDLLIAVSTNTNTRLRVVAEKLALSGDLSL